jgi:hypothetical protein
MDAANKGGLAGIRKMNANGRAPAAAARALVKLLGITLRVGLNHLSLTAANK